MAYLIAPDETDGDRSGSVILPRRFIVTPEDPADHQLTSSVGSGGGTISGDILVGGADPTDAYAVLFNESNGQPIGYMPVAPDGTYAFTDVGAGNYAVMILDATGTKRAKVLHTVLT